MAFTFKLSEREACIVADALEKAVNNEMITAHFATDDFAEVFETFDSRLKY